MKFLLYIAVCSNLIFLPCKDSFSFPLQTCPDGICDSFEKTHPEACPQDCQPVSSQQTYGAELQNLISHNSPFAIHNPKVLDRQLPSGSGLPVGIDEAKDVTAMGAKWARYAGGEGLVWDCIEQEKGKYDWSRTDYMFSDAYNNGLKLVVVINSFNRIDQPEAYMARGIGVSAKIPRFGEAYLKFLEKAVERYDGDGVEDAPGSPVVNYWEIENEVDFKIFWSDTPENYARLLKESYRVIKKTNPNAKVLIAGMSEQLNKQESYDYYFKILKALDGIKDNPGDKYFDIFGIHLYNFGNTQIEVTRPHIHAISSKLKEYGYDVPFWLTETADFSDTPAFPLAEFPISSKSEKEQAIALFKIYTYSLASGIKKIFWVTLTEWSGFQVTDSIWDNVGLINNSNTDGVSHKKLSYYTYRKMVEMLEGSDWNAIQIVQEKGVYIYKFIKNGKPIYVVWNDSGAVKNVKIPLEDDVKNIRIIAAVPSKDTGNELHGYKNIFKEEQRKVNKILPKSINFKVSNIPVFVEGI